MSGNNRGGLFRARNVLGAALIAGIGLGIYLGPLLKGLGLGGGNIPGTNGQKTDAQATLGTPESVTPTDDSTRSSNTKEDMIPETATDAVKVLIDDRTIFLRQPDQDIPIELPRLMKIVKLATGDPNGFKIRIYEKASARTSVEESLKRALENAGISDTEVFWAPNPVK